jgi:Ca-activated chloride channel homolog
LGQAYQPRQPLVSPPPSEPVILRHQTEKDFLLVPSESQSLHVILEVLPTESMLLNRLPLNSAWVLDHSASMKGAKLRSVKEAMKVIIDRLEPTDSISVIIFDDTSQVLIPSQPAHDKISLKAAIDSIGIDDARDTVKRFMSIQ